ncbi:MAG: hypothetical protein L0312_01565, partial [Acidobacteria bacterium]|nr:hypothetical protein [Acidobacteriota bacterium]
SASVLGLPLQTRGSASLPSNFFTRSIEFLDTPRISSLYSAMLGKLGLILNFRRAKLEWERIVLEKDRAMRAPASYWR